MSPIGLGEDIFDPTDLLPTENDRHPGPEGVDFDVFDCCCHELADYGAGCGD
jgi:hypothetical protein